MITRELLEQAIATAHEQCGETCIHQEAVGEAKEALNLALANALEVALHPGIDPGLFFFHMGLHVGYRLHQLEYAENPPNA